MPEHKHPMRPIDRYRVALIWSWPSTQFDIQPTANLTSYLPQTRRWPMIVFGYRGTPTPMSAPHLTT